MAFRKLLLNSWLKPNLLTLILWPLSLLYRIVFGARKQLFKLGLLTSYRAAVPVIVVGNITVGGTGKTPLVIYLVEQLQDQGFSPGVISRGYHSTATRFPLEITADLSVEEAGDEPMLIVSRTAVPMMIGPDRGKAIKALLETHAVDVVISDDGLQHFALQRDIEICIVDHTSAQLNRCLLPAGPFRESAARLRSVDYVVHHYSDLNDADSNGIHSNRADPDSPNSPDQVKMQLMPCQPRPLIENSQRPFDSSQPIHALAGIGNPQRFFKSCEQMAYTIERHEFPDHHRFSTDDIHFDDGRAVLMTEKDAVKCKEFASSEHWYLPVDAKLSGELIDDLVSQLKRLAK